MKSRITDLLKQKEMKIPSLLFYNLKKLNIDHKELVVLIYFLNSKSMFNPKEVGEILNFSMPEILELVSNLKDKKLISLELKTIEGKREEHINLDYLYNALAMVIVSEEVEEEESNIFTLFESEFGRTLSPSEYQIINGWIDMNYTEEMIEKSLKEAVYNGVNNLRYIDKILYEWNKKNKVITIKQPKVVEEKVDLVDKDIMEYDWLNED